LIEEWDEKKLADSNVNSSSPFCAVNFAQTNPQTNGTSVGDTTIPNPSAQLMNHFHSKIIIDDSSPTFSMTQQTTTSMFGQRYP
jgi:hypothetical protein